MIFSALGKYLYVATGTHTMITYIRTCVILLPKINIVIVDAVAPAWPVVDFFTRPGPTYPSD